MRQLLRLLACTALVGAAGAAAQVAHPSPTSPEAVRAAQCKAASFARRPAGQMATTMRDFEIKRCIKNGFLD